MPLLDGVVDTLVVVEAEGVMDGLAPTEREAVALDESVALREADVEGVPVGVCVDVVVRLAVGVPLDDIDAVSLPDMDALDVAEGVQDEVGVLLAEAPKERVVEGVLVKDGDTAGADDSLALIVDVAEAGIAATVLDAEPVADVVSEEDVPVPRDAPESLDEVADGVSDDEGVSLADAPRR